MKVIEGKLSEMEREYGDHEYVSSLIELEKMLSYHDIHLEQWHNQSENERRKMWLDYRSFGRD